jgi:uncharacterized membrane protein YgdD (TMEM256/DUF423 family)
MQAMNWSAVAAILLGLAVMIGAFGAHALEARLDVYSRGVYETAVMYHFLHALGMLIVSVLPRTGALAQSAGPGCAGFCAGGSFCSPAASMFWRSLEYGRSARLRPSAALRS